MADWRVKGFVPDSDDEDDDLSLEDTPGDGESQHIDPEDDAAKADPRNDSQPSPLARAAQPPPKVPPSSLILGATSSPAVHRRATTIDVPSPAQIDRPSLAKASSEAEPSHQSSPIADRLKQEIQRGLEVCRDVLRSSPPPRSDGSDSPLSSLPSSPESSTPAGSRAASPSAEPSRRLSQDKPTPSLHIGIQGPLVQHHLQDDTPASSPVGAPVQSQVEQQTTTDNVPLPAAVQELRSGPVRSFRQRAPLQLHPYSLEAAKYQNEWKQRGLRPIRIAFAQEAQQRPRNSRNDESQGSAAFSSDHEDSYASLRASTPASLDSGNERSQSPRRRPTPSLKRQVLIDKPEDAQEDNESVHTDDELPDIDDIFRDASKVSRSDHRPKDSGFLRSTQRNVTGHNPSAQTERRSQQGSSKKSSMSIYDLPPSPPRSRSLSSSTNMLQDDEMAEHSAVPLPTPIVSSETRPAKRRIIDVSSSSDDESNDSDEAEAAEAEVPAYLQMRRKIKGVLPASWIKLDARQQDRPTDKQALSRSPEKRPAKGVARPVSAHSTSPSTRPPLVFGYSSESEEDHDLQVTASGRIQAQSDVRALFDRDDGDVIMDDVFEDDSIDRMLPSGPRRTATKPRRKRQQRLSDSWDIPALTSNRKGKVVNAASTTVRQRLTHSSKKHTTKRQKRSQRPQLSILDAPGLIRQDHTFQPRYLRVAARARSSGQRPRAQNPQQKFFQLDTAEDTADVNADLHDWTSGRLAHGLSGSGNSALQSRAEEQKEDGVFSRMLGQAHKTQTHRNNISRKNAPNRQRVVNRLAKTAPRPTQRPIHNNGSQLGATGDPTDTVRFLKAATDNTLARLQQNAIEDVPTDDIIDNTTLAHHRLRPGFVSWHQNRAGGGGFWHTNSSSRPTQLETAATFQRPLKRVPRPILAAQQPPEHTLATSPASTPTDVQTAVTKKPKKSRRPARRNNSPPQAGDQRDATDMTRFFKDHPPARQAKIDEIMKAAKDERELTLAPFPCDGTRLEFSSYTTSNSILAAATTTDITRLAPLSTLISTGQLRDLDAIHNVTTPVLRALSRLLSTSYSLSKVVTPQLQAGQEPSALDTYERCMVTLIRCLMQHDSVDVLIKFAQSRGDTLSSETWPVVQAWLIVFMALRTPPPNTSIDLDTVLPQQFNIAHPSSSRPAWMRLHYLVRVIAGLEFMSRLDLNGVFNTRATHAFKLWPMLSLGLRSFFEQQRVGIEQWKRTGMSAVNLCLWLVENCGWQAPDTLMQMLFQEYGKMDMCDLFVTTTKTTTIARVASDHFDKPSTDNPTDFEVFLRLIARSLQEKASTNWNSTDEATGKRSKALGLVFSLTPNNSRAMHEGDGITNFDILSMANTYALYMVLYNGAPETSRPRVTQVENLVDFESTHASVRYLAIMAWGKMAKTAISNGATIPDHMNLGRQGKAMFNSLIRKVQTAIGEDVNDANSVNVVRNCRLPLKQVGIIIHEWAGLLEHVHDVADIKHYFGVEQLNHMLSFFALLEDYRSVLSVRSYDGAKELAAFYCKQDPHIDVLELLRALILRKIPNMRDEAFSCGRTCMSRILRYDTKDSAKIKKAVDIWFALAKLDVGISLGKWDLYLRPPSWQSFRILANTETSQQAEILFISNLLAEAPDYFALDPEWLYSSWIVAILQPDSGLMFECFFTKQIVEHNPSTLDLTAIYTLIQDEIGSVEPLLPDLFRHLRTRIVRLLIQSIFRLQFSGPDDSQDLIEEPLDAATGRRFLQLINKTMKNVWKRLSAVEQLAGYTSFVQAIVQEIQIYDYPGFELDAWYTDPQRTEFPIGDDRFIQLFKRVQNSTSRVLDKDFVATFRQHNQKAANTQDQDRWIHTMVKALACNDVFEDIKDDGTLTMDSDLQIRFIQNVLSTYVECAFLKGPRHGVWAIPILHILTHVLRNVCTRQDLSEPGKVEALSYMCVQVLASTHQALENLSQCNMPREHHTLMFATHLIDLAALCINRLWQFRQMHPEIEVLSDLLDPVSASAHAILAYITDPTFATQPDKILRGSQSPHGETILLVEHAMNHLASAGPLPALPGTDAGLRQLVLNDIDAALRVGRQPLGLAADWAFWHDGNCATFAGWEGVVERGEELAVFAGAVKEFCAVAEKGAGVLVDGEWRVWERLAGLGVRVMRLGEENWEVEEECVVDGELEEERGGW